MNIDPSGDASLRGPWALSNHPRQSGGALINHAGCAISLWPQIRSTNCEACAGGYLVVPAPEQGPTLLVQVPPDQFQCYQRELQDLQHLLFPGPADPSEEITTARARRKEGSHLVILRDSITKIKVCNEEMKPGELRQLVLNGWKCMMACICGAWSINHSHWGSRGRHVLDPLLPQRRGLLMLSNSLSGQVIKHAEGNQLSVRYGQIMANLERSLRTYSLYPSGGILSFLHVRTVDGQG